jgi:hypothetical protein
VLSNALNNWYPVARELQVLRIMGQAAGLPINSPSYEAPALLKAGAAGLFALAGERVQSGNWVGRISGVLSRDLLSTPTVNGSGQEQVGLQGCLCWQVRVRMSADGA